MPSPKKRLEALERYRALSAYLKKEGIEHCLLGVSLGHVCVLLETSRDRSRFADGLLEWAWMKWDDAESAFFSGDDEEMAFTVRFKGPKDWEEGGAGV